MTKKKKAAKPGDSAITGTPVTSEDLKEQGIENYGDVVVKAPVEDKELEELDKKLDEILFDEEAPAEEAEKDAD